MSRRTCTLAFVDIVGSTALWEVHRERFEPVLTKAMSVLRDSVAAYGGSVVKSLGDGLMLSFDNASEAILCSVGMHAGLAAVDWQGIIAEVTNLNVRIGLHAGEVLSALDEKGETDYLGPTVNRVARIQAAAHPRQTLASRTVVDLAPSPEGVDFVRLGTYYLPGAGEEVLFDVRTASSPTFKPPRVPRADREMLPASRVEWIGPEARLQELRHLVKAGRLVTLTGIGGSGKSSTALAAAQHLLLDFEEGVRWVDCEEADDLEGRIRRMVAPSLPDGTPLTEALKSSKLLLVLDGLPFEEASPQLVGLLLAACPGLRILATSRRPLELSRERVFEIPPMSEGEGLLLFGERAESVQPSFRIGEGNEADIAEVCRTVGGLPLAIELAASLVRNRTPREILNLLVDGIRALSRKGHDIPQRQRSMTAMLQTSFGTLNPSAQDLWCDLALLSGPFDRSEAKALSSSAPLDAGLEDLVAEGLLRTQTDQRTQKTLYSLSWCVREFGRDLLSEDLVRNHAARGCLIDLLVARLGQAEEAARSSREVDALYELRRRDADLGSAVAWTLSNAGAERISRLTLAVAGYWVRVGQSRQALEVARQGLEHSEGFPSLHAALLAIRCSACIDVLDWASAETAISDAEGVLDQIESVYDRARLQVRLDAMNALVCEGQGEIEKSRDLQKRSLSRAIDLGDRTSQAIALHNLGKLEMDSNGDLERARENLSEALRLRTEIGDVRGRAETLTNLGLLDFGAGQTASALTYHREALRAESELQNRFGMGRSLFNLAEVAEALGEETTAGDAYRGAEIIFRRLGSPYADLAATEASRLAGTQPSMVDVDDIVERLLALSS